MKRFDYKSVFLRYTDSVCLADFTFRKFISSTYSKFILTTMAPYRMFSSSGNSIYCLLIVYSYACILCVSTSSAKSCNYFVVKEINKFYLILSFLGLSYFILSQ